MMFARAIATIATTVSVLATVSLACSAAEIGPSPEGGWSGTFTMRLKDRDRPYVERNGAAYLVMENADLEDPLFISGKDVMLPAKFEHAEADRAFMFALPHLVAMASAEEWSQRIEGDNLFVFGKVTCDKPGHGVLAVVAVTVGASDTQVISEKLAAIKPDDWAGRLRIADWVRDQAKVQGNREYWLVAADAVLGQTIEKAIVIATERKNAELLANAFSWALDQVGDPGLAAKVASQEWFQVSGGAIADQVSRRLRSANFDLYKGTWRPRSESLALQFDDRFNAIPWRESDEFYKLGRWVEANSEDLPRAREMTFKCYQAGFRANPNHAAIRRELGLGLAGAGGGPSDPFSGPFQHQESGIMVGGPGQWQRVTPVDGLATWVHPDSGTSYLSASVISGEQLAGTFDKAWESALLPWKVRGGFAAEAAESATAPFGVARSMHFTYLEGTDTRQADFVLIHHDQSKTGVSLVVAYLDGGRDAAKAALLDCVSKVTFPANAAELPSPLPPMEATDEPQPEPDGANNP